MNTAARVGISEFLEFEPSNDSGAELIDGEILLSPDPKPLHLDVEQAIEYALRRAVEPGKGSSFVVKHRVNIILTEDDSMPSPDVFVIDRERWNKALRENTHPLGSPQLAIEVLSPSNTQALIRRKIQLYLKNGAAAAWLVSPEKKKILVATADDESEYRMGEEIPLPKEIHPSGISLAVREFFEA